MAVSWPEYNETLKTAAKKTTDPDFSLKGYKFKKLIGKTINHARVASNGKTFELGTKDGTTFITADGNQINVAANWDLFAEK